MNCDDAFEALTDPQPTDRRALAAHLESCPRCRQMRETLSPALEWLSSDDDSAGGGHWSSGGTVTPLLTAQALRIAEQAAKQLPRQPGTAARLRTLGAMAAVALIGVAVGAFGIDSRHELASLPQVGADSMLTACLWTTPQGRSGLPDTSARGVVVSCVMCHVPSSLE